MQSPIIQVLVLLLGLRVDLYAILASPALCKGQGMCAACSVQSCWPRTHAAYGVCHSWAGICSIFCACLACPGPMLYVVPTLVGFGLCCVQPLCETSLNSAARSTCSGWSVTCAACNTFPGQFRTGAAYSTGPILSFSGHHV